VAHARVAPKRKPRELADDHAIVGGATCTLSIRLHLALNRLADIHGVVWNPCRCCVLIAEIGVGIPSLCPGPIPAAPPAVDSV